MCREENEVPRKENVCHYMLKCMQMQGIAYEHVEVVTILLTNTGKIQGSISESIDTSLYYFRHL